MNIQGPLFLVGCPRSGTTLLQQMLDSHPAVAIAPETFFIERFWLRRDHYGELTNDSKFHRLIEDIISLPEFGEMELNPDDFREAVWQSKRDYPTVFQLLLEQFARLRSVRIVGEKTPKHLLHMETLQHFFPTARFIHIVRDPRAVVRSWQKVPWSSGSLAGDAKIWRRYVAKARHCSPTLRASLFTLYYERLVSEPEKTLRDLCGFLELDYQPAMMNYADRKTQLVNVVREPWKANAITPISQTSLNRWQTELSPSALVKVEVAAGPEMTYFGYQPVTSFLPLFSAKLIAPVKFRLRSIFKFIKTYAG